MMQKRTIITGVGVQVVRQEMPGQGGELVDARIVRFVGQGESIEVPMTPEMWDDMIAQGTVGDALRDFSVVKSMPDSLR